MTKGKLLNLSPLKEKKMQKKKKTFKDTVLFVIFFAGMSVFAAFMAILVYILRLLGVH